MNNECLFCMRDVQPIIQHSHFYAVYDDFPVRQGHMLIIPTRHVESITSLTIAEFCSLYFIMQKAVKYIKHNFHADGYNLGINCGQAAGQTIPHLHIHLIPRYVGDVQNPHGGIRNFLPNPVKEYPATDEQASEE